MNRSPRPAGHRSWATGADHALVAVSPGLARLLGVPREALLGRSRLELWGRAPGEGRAWRAHLRALGRGRPFANLPCETRHGDGSRLRIVVDGRPRLGPDGAVVGWHGSVRVVEPAATGRGAGAAPGGWSLTLASGRIVDSAGRTLATVGAADLGLLREHLARSAAGSAADVIVRATRGDGAVRWYHLRGDIRLAGGGRVHGAPGTLRDLSADLERLDALLALEDDFRTAQALAGVGSWRLDLATGAVVWSDELYRIMGHAPGGVTPSRALLAERMHPADRAGHFAIVEAAIRAGSAYRNEYRIVRPDGEVRLILSHGRCRWDESGRVTGLVGTMQDVTEQRRTEQILREQAVMLREAQALAGIGTVWRRIDATRSSWSDEMFRLLGLEPGAVEPCFASLHERVHPEDRTRHRALVDEVQARGTTEDEIRIVRADGAVRTLWTRVHVEPDPAGGSPFIFATHLDITDLKDTERKLETLAFYDPLTGLANRSMFNRELERLAASPVGRAGACEALLLIDLDRFKEVNDTLGHAAGDRLLVEVAARLRAQVRAGDLVARLGGDEFALILRRADGSRAAGRAAERIGAALRRPFDVDGHETHVSASIGIALAKGGTRHAETLLRQADLALYAVKERGRDGYRFFEPELNQVVMRRRSIETELRAALREGTLELHYQPQVELASLRVISAEALLRWRRPDGTFVPPERFIPIAEGSGLIVELGAWVVERAIADAAALGRGLAVAVNLSAAQLKDAALVPRVAEALERHGVAPARLHLELTESVLADRRDAPAMRALERLAELGTTLCLDDFGTGYSSLGYLADMPFRVLKVDRRFVAAIGRDERTAAIVPAIVGLGRSLGLGVVAEGIETRAQLDRLRALGCDVGQGYLLGRPVPLGELPITVSVPARHLAAVG